MHFCLSLDIILFIEGSLGLRIIRSLEGSSSNSFLLGILGFRLGSIEDLQEGSDSVSHSGVHEGFGTLDVVVEIVTEGLDIVNCLLLLVASNVRLEEDERDEAIVIANSEVSNSL